MKIYTLIAGALLASASTVAFAQSTTAPAAPPANTQAGTPQIRSQIASDLKAAGYTDVSVMPDAYMVHAKDKAGEPVFLSISPNSVTEVVMGDAMPMAKGAAAPTSQSGSAMFTSVPTSERLSSKLVGTDVYNKENKDIGTIKDIAFGPGGAVRAYVLGVGGFLGMGDHYVAVRPSAVTVSWDGNAKKWHAVLDTNADNLKKAPEFKYPA